MNDNVAFIELVQLHERQWGTQAYPGRPTLVQLFQSPIVAVWVSARGNVVPKDDAPGRFILTAHGSADDFHGLLLSVVLIGQTTRVSSCKLWRLFAQQQPVIIDAIRVSSTKSEAKGTTETGQSDDPIRKQNEHRHKRAQVIAYDKPVVTTRTTPRRAPARNISLFFHTYECGECRSILKAPSTLGSPSCPNCGRKDMRLVI